MLPFQHTSHLQQIIAAFGQSGHRLLHAAIQNPIPVLNLPQTSIQSCGKWSCLLVEHYHCSELLLTWQVSIHINQSNKLYWCIWFIIIVMIIYIYIHSINSCWSFYWPGSFWHVGHLGPGAASRAVPTSKLLAPQASKRVKTPASQRRIGQPLLGGTGVGIDVPTIGDWFHITKITISQISVGDYIPNK